MINTLRIFEELSQALEPKAAQKLAAVLGSFYEDLQQTVTKAEFTELREVVRDLAEAQKRTEQRLDQLTARVSDLAEAQKRTEQRLDQLTARMDQLTVRMDQLTVRMDQLAVRMEELAAAQARTDQALARLTERVEQLTVRMEEQTRRLDETNRQLGGLSATVGYTLENAAYDTLPVLLARDFGLVLDEPLRRDWLADAEGRDLEVNILGRGRRGGEPVWVIGESKVQLSARDVDRFLRRRVEPLRPVCGTIFPVLVAHMVTARDVPAYAREKDVALYLSYQLQRVRPEPQAA